MGAGLSITNGLIKIITLGNRQSGLFEEPNCDF